MEQQFVVTHQYTIYGRWKKNLILDRPTLRHVKYLWKYKDRPFFCGHKILIEGAFETALSSNDDLSLTNCMGYDTLLFHEW